MSHIATVEATLRDIVVDTFRVFKFDGCWRREWGATVWHANAGKHGMVWYGGSGAPRYGMQTRGNTVKCLVRVS